MRVRGAGVVAELAAGERQIEECGRGACGIGLGTSRWMLSPGVPR
ncbi:MAG: hypothetical protein ACK5HA_02425 [Planctomycetaceae bacterium]